MDTSVAAPFLIGGYGYWGTLGHPGIGVRQSQILALLLLSCDTLSESLNISMAWFLLWKNWNNETVALLWELSESRTPECSEKFLQSGYEFLKLGECVLLTPVDLMHGTVIFINDMPCKSMQMDEWLEHSGNGDHLLHTHTFFSIYATFTSTPCVPIPVWWSVGASETNMSGPCSQWLTTGSAGIVPAQEDRAAPV